MAGAALFQNILAELRNNNHHSIIPLDLIQLKEEVTILQIEGQVSKVVVQMIMILKLVSKTFQERKNQKLKVQHLS